MNFNNVKAKTVAITIVPLLVGVTLSYAGSATWNLNPTGSSWNNTANWTPQTIPNGPADIATFDQSNRTSVSIADDITVESIVFNEGAGPFKITLNPLTALTVFGSLINNSSATQQFELASTPPFNDSVIILSNGATIGNRIAFSLDGGSVTLFPGASAGSAAFTIRPVTAGQANITFFGNSTAADATLTLDSGVVYFYDDSTAANAIVTLENGLVLFVSTATAANATIVMDGATKAGFTGSFGDFYDNTTLAEASLTLQGGTVSDAVGAGINFQGDSTAADGTVVLNGGIASGAAGATIEFGDSTTAGNATFAVNGGTNGGDGALLQFSNTSSGGLASLAINGNGQLDITGHKPPGMTVGSLSGDGLVTLGANQLTVGANDLDTTFSGTIQNTGSVAKTGAGTLTLAGANTYTGGTTVSAGTLVVSNKIGSATGAGAVTVSGGTLGGSGIISGAVTVIAAASWPRRTGARCRPPSPSRAG